MCEEKASIQESEEYEAWAEARRRDGWTAWQEDWGSWDAGYGQQSQWSADYGWHGGGGSGSNPEVEELHAQVGLATSVDRSNAIWS